MPCPLQCSWHSWLPWGAPSLLLSLRDPGALCEPFSGNGSLHRQAVTPMKPGGGITHGAISSSFVGDKGSGLMLCTFDSSAHCHQTILSPELQLWGLCLEPCKMGGKICPVATPSLEGCITSLHPGSQFQGLLLFS